MARVRIPRGVEPSLPMTTWLIYVIESVRPRRARFLGRVEARSHPGALGKAWELFGITTAAEQRQTYAGKRKPFFDMPDPPEG